MHVKTLHGGLWPVMLTPFKENNEVDYNALEELTYFYLRAGANGLFANCLSSEMFQLTNQERLQVIDTVVKIASKNNVQVVASGTFNSDMNSSADFIKKVHEAGAAAVILISNQLAPYNENEDNFKQKVEVLLKLTGDIPLGIYECPYPYKRLISPALINWLGQTGRFFYHKDTSCEPVSIHQKIEALKGSNCSLFNANTATSLTSLEMGAAGLSPIGANFYPELYTRLFEEHKISGPTKSLKKLNDQLNLMDAIASQCYPYSAKLFLQFRKQKLSTTCRIQYTNMHIENYLQLKSLEQVFYAVSEELGIGIG